MDYRIVKKEAFAVVGKTLKTGTENGENQRTIPAFWQQCGQDGTVETLTRLGPGRPLLGICSMPPGEELLTYWVAVEIEPDAPVPDGYGTWTVPAAAWAVFPSVGPVTPTIQQVWGRIYSEWFPSSGYEHADAPELEVYPGGNTEAEDYMCEVWIPIIGKQG